MTFEQVSFEREDILESQNVAKKFLELISNMLQINLQDLFKNRFILSNQNLVQLRFF